MLNGTEPTIESRFLALNSSSRNSTTVSDFTPEGPSCRNKKKTKNVIFGERRMDFEYFYLPFCTDAGFLDIKKCFGVKEKGIVHGSGTTNQCFGFDICFFFKRTA